jgi:hypothetical protein
MKEKDSFSYKNQIIANCVIGLVLSLFFLLITDTSLLKASIINDYFYVFICFISSCFLISIFLLLSYNDNINRLNDKE